MLRAGEWKLALFYILASNVFGLLFAFGGFVAGRALFRAA
jgi:fluoride ion exporter CrcB/FEX